ncbi:MAG: PIN domain-containing protein, partial [Actinomycetes bacterium]|nr:PIN domain-containing protein [Actinomycetes bacterium]MDX5450089.1 PIN domain-containing protein [Actinomycetes bacterium]
MKRFAEHSVVLPVVVITELEAKRRHPELGYFARSALRMLDDLRVQHGKLDEPVAVNETGGTVRVELNHTDQEVLPSGFRLGDNDTRILAVAANLRAEGHHVTVVSKDLPMRVKASALGIEAEEYRAELAIDSGWTGMREIQLTDEQMASLWEHESLPAPPPADCGEDLHALPIHTGLVIHSGRGSALGRIGDDGAVRLVRGDQEVFGIHGRSAEQRIAIDLLLDESVGIVSMGGRAGTGKSAL